LNQKTNERYVSICFRCKLFGVCYREKTECEAKRILQLLDQTINQLTAKIIVTNSTLSGKVAEFPVYSPKYVADLLQHELLDKIK